MMAPAAISGLRVIVLTAVAAGLLVCASPARAQHAEAPAAVATPTPVADDAHGAATTPAAEHGDASAAAHAPVSHDAAGQADGGHGEAGGHGEEHGESILVTLARFANFAILVGVLYYFGRKPLADHLASRRTEIRHALVEAADLRQTATARLAEIEQKLAALPQELEQLRLRGAEELDAERARIRAAAEAERDRLVEQARREIATQTRNARATLRAEAAALAVDVAESQLRASLTPGEQSALVDRYATQMRNVQ